MKYSKVGMLLLAAWLILKGAMPLFDIRFSRSGTITDIIAVGAGMLIFITNL